MRLRVSLTRGLAHVLDSLVRVSRRVEWGRVIANVLGASVRGPTPPERPAAVATQPTLAPPDGRRRSAGGTPSRPPASGGRHAPRLLGRPRDVRPRSVNDRLSPRRGQGPTLPRPLQETQGRPTLARAREKCDGRRAEPDGRGPPGSAYEDRPPGTRPA